MINNDLLASKAIERLKLIEAELTIIKSKANEQMESLNTETEELKTQLKEYYYSLPKNTLEETKTLRLYKIGDSKLQEKIQEPEFIRDEKVLIEEARGTNREQYIKIKTIESFDWANVKKQIILQGETVLFENEVLKGVTAKEREPIFEVVLK